ncbi:hypothetical protein KKB99_05880 [bacterium]|nr:hypothetical protein [bacterium]MBU1025516.1 hypothetical protein [bacterium]
MKKIVILTSLIALFVILTGCGGGGTVTPPEGQTGDMTGIVYAPNGTDPVSGVLIYVVDRSGGGTGPAPSEEHYAFDYTNPDGSFSLPEIPIGMQLVKISKGAFAKEFEVNVIVGANALPAASTTLPASTGGGGTVEKMLVVTGNYDNIEVVLAKLGLADVSEYGDLVYGTEKFTLIDGNSSLDDTTYQNFMDFFADPANYADYRTIFFNCGNDYESDFFDNADMVNGLRTWVQSGGRLYCTDWSYDFIEQLFPEFIDFYEGADGLTTTPEEHGLAEQGDSFDQTNATILNANLLAWLQAIGATNADDTVTIEGWLSGWAAIDTIGTSTAGWVEAPVWVMGTESTRITTVTFESGTGIVFYSSYHTEELLSTEILPQERILQYFVFEVL